MIHDENNIKNIYEDHFGKPHQELLSSILEQVVKEKAEKKSEKEMLREKMKEIFNIGNEGE